MLTDDNFRFWTNVSLDCYEKKSAQCKNPVVF